MRRLVTAELALAEVLCVCKLMLLSNVLRRFSEQSESD